MVNKTLNYVTYQSFPAETANSLQTIAQIQEFVKQGLNVNLYFFFLQPINNKYFYLIEFYYAKRSWILWTKFHDVESQ